MPLHHTPHAVELVVGIDAEVVVEVRQQRFAMALQDELIGFIDLFDFDPIHRRAGIIGEIGSSWPWTDSEKKVLEAAVAAQRETGAPLLIHPGRDEKAPIELLAAVDRWGGDLRRTVMAHIDRTIYDLGALNEVAATGAYLNFDMFGHDASYYPLAPHTYMPADHERIAHIEHLVSNGRSSQVLLAHDVCSKHRLKRYGGHGYDHIPTRIIPRLRARGMDEEDVQMVVVDNPTRMLTFA